MIRTIEDLPGNRVLEPVDVCIIGSGAGGGVMAWVLAQAGLKVVVLEKGGYWSVPELGRRELSMLTRLEAPTIFTPTKGKHSRVSLLLGECYGGGTVSHEGVSWDMPEVVWEDWVKLGLSSFSPTNPRLKAHIQEMRTKRCLNRVPEGHHNVNNQITRLGATREGLEWTSVVRPVPFCMRCGNCTQGCRYGLKQDAAATFLTWANEAGAETWCGAQATRLTVNYPVAEDEGWREKLRLADEAGKAAIRTELEALKKPHPARFTIQAQVTDRRKAFPRDTPPPVRDLTVLARQVVLAGGPLGNVPLLLKSGLNPHGVVGKRFSTHPTSFHLARFPDEVNIQGWDGINNTVEIIHYADLNRHKPYFDRSKHGFFLEASFSLPWGFANLAQGVGAEHLERMTAMNHYAGVEVNVKSDSYGEVTADGVHFELSEADNARMLFGTSVAARLFFRAGAREVYPALHGLVLKSPAELDQIFTFGHGYLTPQANLHSGHVFGGCVMGMSPEDSFADETGECHAIKGLWVADSSSFPTNIGVNAAHPVSVVARKTADHFMDKHARQNGKAS